MNCYLLGETFNILAVDETPQEGGDGNRSIQLANINIQCADPELAEFVYLAVKAKLEKKCGRLHLTLQKPMSKRPRNAEHLVD